MPALPVSLVHCGQQGFTFHKCLQHVHVAASVTVSGTPKLCSRQKCLLNQLFWAFPRHIGGGVLWMLNLAGNNYEIGIVGGFLRQKVLLFSPKSKWFLKGREQGKHNFIVGLKKIIKKILRQPCLKACKNIFLSIFHIFHPNCFAIVDLLEYLQSPQEALSPQVRETDSEQPTCICVNFEITPGLDGSRRLWVQTFHLAPSSDLGSILSDTKYVEGYNTVICLSCALFISVFYRLKCEPQFLLSGLCFTSHSYLKTLVMWS